MLYYISGLICIKIKDTISCKDCLLSIMDTAPTSVDDLGHSSIIYGRNLTKRKGRGGLINASQGLFEILKVCEKVVTLHTLSGTSQVHTYLFTLIHNYAIIYFFWSDNTLVQVRTKYTDLNSMI